MQIEAHLKALSLAHQTERKTLATNHATLSGENSQEEVLKRSQSIRKQLLGLASKQKQLLQCFLCQKELVGRLNMLNYGQETAPHHIGAVTVFKSQGDNATVGALHKLTNIQPPALPDNNQPALSVAATPKQTIITVPPPMKSQATNQAHSVSANISEPFSTCPVPAVTRLPSDLAQPVPLDILVKHQFIQPGKGCLSCTLMVYIIIASFRNIFYELFQWIHIILW